MRVRVRVRVRGRGRGSPLYLRKQLLLGLVVGAHERDRGAAPGRYRRGIGEM